MPHDLPLPPVEAPPLAVIARDDPYEADVLADFERWRVAPPSWGTRLLAKPSGKVAKVVQSMVPVEALRAALEHANRLALRLNDEKAILKRAGVGAVGDLRGLPLQQSDQLALQVRRRAMLMAGAGGAAFGLGGAAGMVLDIPALLTLALRSIHRTGLCYGDSVEPLECQRLGIGIFALASANSLEEKQSALAALAHGQWVVDDAWRDGIERVAEREMAKEATVFSLQTLASRVGLHLGSRKSAGVVPVLGALVGSSMNAWYLYDVTQTAQRVFQWRRITAGRSVRG